MAAKTRYWAVIPAAGGGTRMGAGPPKQYRALHQKSVLEWSIAPFLQLEWIDGVVVVLARQDRGFAALPIARHPRIVTTTGGTARADSVLAGLQSVASRSAAFTDVRVLVHDAARPCLQLAQIERLREEADEVDGGILALPVIDTLKRARQQTIAETVDRAQFWRAQTPQLFGLARLQEALEQARAAGVEITDEASAVERLGGAPRLVRGSESNIKLTFAEDLPLAEFWLTQQERRR